MKLQNVKTKTFRKYKKTC